MASCTDAVNIFTSLRLLASVVLLLSVALTGRARDLSCIPSAGSPSSSQERLKHTAWRQHYKGQHAV